MIFFLKFFIFPGNLLFFVVKKNFFFQKQNYCRPKLSVLYCLQYFVFCKKRIISKNNIIFCKIVSFKTFLGNRQTDIKLVKKLKKSLIFNHQKILAPPPTLSVMGILSDFLHFVCFPRKCPEAPNFSKKIKI